jgi:hypothetical protein
MPVRRAAERMVWAATMALVVKKVRVDTNIVWLGAAQRKRRGGVVRCWVCGLSFVLQNWETVAYRRFPRFEPKEYRHSFPGVAR